MVVNVYKRFDGGTSKPLSDEEVKKRSAWKDYNPATEARYATAEMADQVRSRKNRVEYALGDTQEKMVARL